MANNLSSIMADMEAINGSPFPVPRKELKPLKEMLLRHERADLLRAYAVFKVERKQGLSTTPYAFSFEADGIVARLRKDEKRKEAQTDRYSFFPANPDEILALEELL